MVDDRSILSIWCNESETHGTKEVDILLHCHIESTQITPILLNHLYFLNFDTGRVSHCCRDQK